MKSTTQLTVFKRPMLGNTVHFELVRSDNPFFSSFHSSANLGKHFPALIMDKGVALWGLSVEKDRILLDVITAISLIKCIP